VTAETREVAISMEAHLTNDSAVRQKVTETVKIRNDLIRQY